MVRFLQIFELIYQLNYLLHNKGIMGNIHLEREISIIKIVKLCIFGFRHE